MAKAVLELEAITGNWDGGLRKAQTALQNFITTNGGLHGAIEKNSQTMVDAIRKIGDMESKAKTASGRLREMESMFTELGMRYNELSAAEKSADIGQASIESLEKLKARIIETKSQMKGLQDQLVQQVVAKSTPLTRLSDNGAFHFLKDADLSATRDNMHMLDSVITSLGENFRMLREEEQKALGSDFQSVINDLQGKLYGLEERFGSILPPIKQVEEEVKQLETPLERLAQKDAFAFLDASKLEATKENMSAIDNAIKALGASYAEMDEEMRNSSTGRDLSSLLSELQGKMYGLEQRYGSIMPPLKQVEEETKKAATAFERLAQRDKFAFLQNVDMSGTRESMRSLDSAIKTLAADYQNLSDVDKRSQIGKDILEHANDLQNKLYGLEQRYGALGVEIQKTDKKISGTSFGKQFAQRLIPGFGMGVGAVGAMAAVKAVRMLGDAVKYGIETNKEFEQSNANLSAVLGKSKDEIMALTINAEKLGATTLYTANQISELQTVLARRGFNQDQILQMTHGISNLALATGTGLAESAELAGATMQAFGMKATEMERIVSVLGVSTTKSALTTEKLGTALRYVAPNARAAGFSLEDTVAMLGVLVDNGLEASMAGTSLRQILMAMSTENGKLARSFGHPIRSMEDFIQAISDISMSEDVLSDMSEEVRVTAVPAIVALANSKDRVEELRNSLEGVNDELKKMAEKQENTLLGSITLLKSAWDGLMLSMGQGNTGPLKSGFEKLAMALNDLSDAIRMRQGGEHALSVVEYSPEVSQKAAAGSYANLKEKGYSDEAIAKATTNKLITSKKNYDELMDLLKYLYTPGDNSVSDARFNEIQGNRRTTAYLGDYGKSALMSDLKKAKLDYETDKALLALVVKDKEETKKEAAKPIKDILLGAIKDAQTALDKETDITKIPGLKQALANAQKDYDDVFGNKSASSAKTDEQKAHDKVADALRRYQEAMDLATAEYQNEVIDEKQWFRKKINAEESVYKAYAEAYAIFNDPKFKEGMVEWMQKVSDTSANLTHMNEALDAMTEEMKRKAAEQKALVDADKSIYGQMKSAVGKGSWERIAQDGGDLNARFAAMKVQLDGGVEIPDKDWEDFVKDLNEKLLSLKLAPIQLDLEAGTVNKMANEVKDIATKWGYVAQAVSSVGSAMQSIEDPSAKIAGIVATAVASTALGFAQASTADSKFGTFAWIASAAAGLANMTAMIASIKQVTAEYHADGGFVGGGPRGTDTVNTWLTPGELVLNRAQQTNLAAQLQPARGYGDIHMEKIITGEDIRIVLTNNARRRGGTGKNYAI